MKKYVILLVIIGLGIKINLKAQETENKFGISFSGFVKNDFFFDSRQTVNAREGHFLLWPTAELLDDNGDDINAKPNLNFLAIQSRIKGAISGPDAFGAKTSGVIEADFFAQANDNINLLRLRHAFIKLNWTNTEILTGQYWNPLFVTDCYPGTVSFSTGTPLQSFSRNPQVRVTHNMGGLKLTIAALTQRDYSSRGPDPKDNTATLISSDFLRNSSVPDMHVNLQYGVSNEETGTSMVVGAGLAYKTIVPRLSSTAGVNTYKVDEKVSGLTVIGYTKISLQPVTIKLQGRYGENIADVMSISGFAVKDTVNATTGEMEYTPLKNITFWGEIHSNGTKMQLGIFGGYLKNLGTKEALANVANIIYGLEPNIESLLRISPRIVCTSGNFKVACELEYTAASYGDSNTYDVNHVPSSTTTVSNIRLLVSTIYNF